MKVTGASSVNNMQYIITIETSGENNQQIGFLNLFFDSFWFLWCLINNFMKHTLRYFSSLKLEEIGCDYIYTPYI